MKYTTPKTDIVFIQTQQIICVSNNKGLLPPDYESLNTWGDAV